MEVCGSSPHGPTIPFNKLGPFNSRPVGEFNTEFQHTQANSPVERSRTGSVGVELTVGSCRVLGRGWNLSGRIELVVFADWNCFKR